MAHNPLITMGLGHHRILPVVLCIIPHIVHKARCEHERVIGKVESDFDVTSTIVYGVSDCLVVMKRSAVAPPVMT